MKMNRMAAALLWSALAALLICPLCAPGGEPKDSLIVKDSGSSLVCKDCDGREVELRKGAQRVVVCYSSFVELWILAGGKPIAMVDTVNKTNLPESAREIPTIGSFVNPNIEKILSLNPDFILLCGKIEKHRALGELLKERGIQNILLDYENYNDFIVLLDLFAKLNGKSLKEIPEAERILSDVAGIIKKAASLKGPRFISLFASAKDISAETSSSNTACMASLLGGVNAVNASGLPIRRGTGSVKFSLERMIMENPDLIIVTTMGDSKEIQARMRRDMMSDPAWQSVKAIKDDKLYFLPNELFLYKSNGKYPEAFRHLARILYPEEKW